MISAEFIIRFFGLGIAVENDFAKKGGEGGPVALQFFGYLKSQLELLVFTNVFISKRYT